MRDDGSKIPRMQERKCSSFPPTDTPDQKNRKWRKVHTPKKVEFLNSFIAFKFVA